MTAEDRAWKKNMRYTAFEFTWYDSNNNRRTLRVGRSLVYGGASIIIALATGHHFLFPP
jgi:hypothetical protein